MVIELNETNAVKSSKNANRIVQHCVLFLVLSTLSSFKAGILYINLAKMYCVLENAVIQSTRREKTGRRARIRYCVGNGGQSTQTGFFIPLYLSGRRAPSHTPEEIGSHNNRPKEKE